MRVTGSAELHRIRVHALTSAFSLQAAMGIAVASALRSSSSRDRAGGRAVGRPPAVRCETAGMRFADLAATTEAVRATGGRREKVERLAEALRALDPAEVAAGSQFLAGEPGGRVLGVGWAALRERPPAAAAPELSVADVDAALGRLAGLSGPGSQAARRAELVALLTRATESEQAFLVALMLGDLRQGALAAVVADAVARAAELPPADVRRALMLRGDLGAVAEAALHGGAGALAAFRLEVGRPLQPMLAQTAPDVAAALERTGPAAVEWKLDGARVQVHRDGDDVAVFTRNLDDVTARLPEVVEAARALPARAAVLDGEAIALRPDGRPQPFQVTGSRFASRRNVDELRRAVPLTPMLFDLLHLDGEDLLDRPGAERAAALDALVPPDARVPRVVAEDATAGEAALAGALGRGHEGVVVKALAAPYEAGRRGAAWVKVKPVHTLDLVVLAAEWGHGRRRGWLSNLHLGARADGGFVMLGKTFKGLTDAMLTWQTQALLALEVAREGHVVHVRPELVVEIAFDGIQTSPRYPGGVALRFARVLRHRPDKPAAEADTLEAVLAVAPSAGG
jgi:DNA ligase 1